RRLVARLLDASAKDVADPYPLDLLLDDRPPRDMALVVDDQIEKGTSTLPVKASVTPPASGLKEVAFGFGPEADFGKTEAAGQTIKGQPSDPGGRTWTAILTVPKDASGKLFVTARFTTGVGLTAFKTEEVAVMERPAQIDANAKPAPLKPG